MPVRSALEAAVTPELAIDVDGLAGALRVTTREFSLAAGLTPEAITKTEKIQMKGLDRTQARLRDIVEILRQVERWAGSAPQAYAWYRAERLPSFGDTTAEDLVKNRGAEAVKAHLARIAAGGHA